MYQSTRKIKLFRSVSYTTSKLLEELPIGATPIKVIINHEYMDDITSEVVIIGHRLPVFFSAGFDKDSKPGDVFLVYTL